MKQKLWIPVLLFVIVACAQGQIVPLEAVGTPTFTPWAAGTETARAQPTPWVAGTETALAAVNANVLPTWSFPTATLPAEVIRPTDFSPVLYGKKYDANTFFLLLGGVRRDAWLSPEVSTMRFADEANYSLHTLQQEYKYYFWGKTPDFSPVCASHTIGTDIDVNEPGMVAVLDGWNIAKRPVAELSAESEFYKQVVIDWLAGEGVAAPQVGALHIFRVDLEGDGTDEIFISATHLDDSQHTTQAGDYSINLMRRVVGNDAVTTFLVGDVYRSQDLEVTYPRTYSLGNFIDLNQDGVLEVVVDIQQWEGFGAIVYQVDGPNVIQALRAEC